MVVNINMLAGGAFPSLHNSAYWLHGQSGALSKRRRTNVLHVSEGMRMQLRIECVLARYGVVAMAQKDSFPILAMQGCLGSD